MSSFPPPPPANHNPPTHRFPAPPPPPAMGRFAPPPPPAGGMHPPGGGTTGTVPPNGGGGGSGSGFPTKTMTSTPVAALNTAMSQVSVQGGRTPFAPPPPQPGLGKTMSSSPAPSRPMFSPPPPAAVSGLASTSSMSGPPAGGNALGPPVPSLPPPQTPQAMPTMMMPPSKPAMFTPPGQQATMMTMKPPAMPMGGGGGGPTVFQPGPPMPGGAATAAATTTSATPSFSSPFYPAQPTQGMMMDRTGGVHTATTTTTPTTMPGMMPGTMPPGPTMVPGAPVAGGGPDHLDYSITLPMRLFRLTAGKLPATVAQATACKVPLGAVLRPLAPAPATDPAGMIATVQPGTAGIIRCKRCRTYINPFAIWTDLGRRWRCNICGQINDCPSAYFCHLDELGLRSDRLDRPELSQAVVEYIAPAEYMVRPPQEPAYFFVFDVSATAVRSGMLQAAARAVKAALDDLPGRGRTKIGFITFDCAVQYYNLASDLANPQMLVVSDLKQLFVPLPENLLVNLQESRSVVESFLDNLPEMFAANPVVSQSCLGSALKAAFTVMKEIGGKMCIFQSILPNLGDGILKPREQPGIMGTPNEVKMLRAESSWYKDTAIEFSRQQISVDFFVFPYQYLDLAALSDLARYSAGSLHSYPGFNLDRDGTRFEEQLHKTLTQPTALEAVMRIRCTKGMKISNFYGNFFIRGQDLMALPNCNTESVFGFDLAHEEQAVSGSHVTVQAALLYTSSDGERRIRVMTQAIPVSSSNTEVLHSVDTDACITLMAKQAIETAGKTSLDNARMRLQQMCVDMYRASKGGDKRMVSGYAVPPPDPSGMSAPGGPGEERPVPDNLALLPLYTLALMKNVTLRGGTDIHPDERVMSQFLLNTMFVSESKHYIYPRMFEIHTMTPDTGRPVPVEDDTIDPGRVAGRNRILLPPVVNLSVDRLTSDGVYLLDNGVEMYLWVGRTADFNVMASLFGTHTLDEIDPNQIKVLTRGDDIASRFGAIVQALREDEADPFVVSAKINIVKEGDRYMESRFFWFMVEDRASFQGGTFSYEEFMQFVNNPSASAGPRPPPGAPGRPGPPGPATGMQPPMGVPHQPQHMGHPPPGGPMARGPPGPPAHSGMGPPVLPQGPPPPPMPSSGGMPPRSAPPVLNAPPHGPPGGGYGGPPAATTASGYGGPPPPVLGSYGGAPPAQGPPPMGSYGGGGPPQGYGSAPPPPGRPIPGGAAPRQGMPPPPPRAHMAPPPR